MKQTVIKLVNGGQHSVFVNGDEFPLPAGPLEILVNSDGSVMLNGNEADKDAWKKIQFEGTVEQLLKLAETLKA